MATTLNTLTLKNIIFDLGDVIIPIDLRAPIRNFAMLAGLSEADVEALWQQHDFLGHYETGLIDDLTFRDNVRQLLKTKTGKSADWADEVIDTAWNTVLLDLPVERVARILELKASGRYRLFLLSNTSRIHIREVNRRLVSLGQPTLEAMFERVFYSYDLNLMKPSPDIYQRVLAETGIVAEETAFLDDNPANVAAAATLGIRATQVQPPLTLLDYLAETPNNTGR
jgi:glucose-1-phosphatase